MIFANRIAAAKQLAECRGKNMQAPAIPNLFCILIFLGMALPLNVSAGALEKYYVPQQQSGSAAQSVTPSSGYVNQDVYTKFKAEVQGYNRDQKNKLARLFRSRLKQANREKNQAAVSHYERLIGILNAEK